MLDDLMKDMCDGAALLSVVHFYCPEFMRLEGRLSSNCLELMSSEVSSIPDPACEPIQCWWFE